MKPISLFAVLCLMVGTLKPQAQTTIPTNGELFLPQYMVSGTVSSKRIQYVCRLALTGLTANTTYRYYTGASTDSALTKSVPGNFICINKNKTSYGNITGYSSQKGYTGTLLANDTFNTVSGANKYAEFVTNASGNYSGYFSIVPTGNTVFAAGNEVYFYIYINDGASGTSVDKRYRTASTISMVNYGKGSSSKECSAVRGNSLASGETFVFIYDNTAGTGRPLYGTWAENDGITTNFTSWYSPTVDTTTGAWGAVIPNANANGIRRVESLDIDGTLLFNHTDADGIWGSGVNTASPTNDTVPLVITVNDAPLGATSPSVSFANASGQVNENGTSITVDVTLSNPNAASTSVDVAVTGGTATGGTDYTYSTTTVTFPANSTTTQTVTINITDDATVEGTETIVLGLQSPTNSATVGNIASETITIVDNDVPSVSFAKTNLTVSENVGTVSVDVNIINPDPTKATTVEVVVSGGTATGGTDYTYTTATLTFPAGSSATQTATLNITDDATTEGVETIILMLQNANNSAGYVNTYDSLTISDNDFPKVAFASSSKTVGENAGTVTLDLTISNPHPTSATTVDVEVAGGTATGGSDYTYTTTTVTFPAGSSANQTVTVNITDDAAFESAETIILTLKNINNNAALGLSMDTITITDNDVNQPTLSFSMDTSSTLEGNSATVTVNIANQAATATTVEVALGTGSTATAGTDFTFTTTTLTFPASSSAPQTVNIATINNNKVMANKTIVLKLQNPSAGAAIGQGNETITIIENGKNGIAEIAAQYGVQLYPNPAKEQVFVSANQKMNNLKVYSLDGRIVYQDNQKVNQYTIPVQHFAQGFYLVAFEINGQPLVQKLAVE